MNPLILVTDASTLGQMWTNLFNIGFQGDTILFGLLLIMGFAYLVITSQIKSGGVVVTGLCLVYLLGIINPNFIFLFYLAIMVSVIMLVFGVKNSSR